MADENTQTETTTAPITETTTLVETTVESKPETTPEVKPEPKGKERSLLTLKDKTETESAETVEAEPTEKPKFEMPEKMKGKSAEEIAEMYVNLEKRGAKPAVPESYDFEALKEHGLTIYDEAHGTETTEMLKDLGLTQEQLAKAGPHWQKQAQRLQTEAFNAGKHAAVVEEFGEPLNKEAQFEAINKEWGTEARAKVEAITKYAETLPDDILNWPLKYSATGLKILERMMQEDLGPQIITDSESGVTEAQLLSELNETTRNPRFGKHGSEADLLEEKANKLSKRIAAIKKR